MPASTTSRPSASSTSSPSPASASWRSPAPTMFQAAQRIGRAIRAVHATEGPALKSEDVSFDVSFLFGGQIKGARMRLFMVYTAGNFIECTTDTPYLQIGEHKYGK